MKPFVVPLLASGCLLLPLVACGPSPAEVEEVSNQATVAEDDPFAETWAAWNAPEQAIAPFRVFDNLSFIGLGWVSMWVIETSEGLILVDTLYGDWGEHGVDGLRALGLDPADIKIVLATHGHFDHAGAIAHFKQEYGAQIGMTEADWELSEQPATDPRFAYETTPRDLVLADGDVVTLGDTSITVRVTPGHTEGVLSLDFEVRDGDARHRAFTFGGVGLNFDGVPRTESYLDSVARIRAWHEEQPIEVNVPNHPTVGDVLGRRDRLAERGEGDPHPFVDPEGYSAWLDEIEAAAEEKLAEEQALASGG